MTPYQFAKAECANWVKYANKPAAICLGIAMKDISDLAPGKRAIVAYAMDRCVLAETPMQRCPYSEAVVLPLADWPSPKEKPRLQQQRLQARASYWDAVGGLHMDEAKPTRRCRDCGGVMGNGHHNKMYCENCLKRRRQTAFRDEKRRQRKAGRGVLQSTPANPHGMGA